MKRLHRLQLPTVLECWGTIPDLLTFLHAASEQYGVSFCAAQHFPRLSVIAVCDECSQPADDHFLVAVLRVGVKVRYTIPSFPVFITSRGQVPI